MDSDKPAYECPGCGRETVQRRAARTPRNIKLRDVDSLLAPMVCRNSECKWTGDEDDLSVEVGRPPEDHKSALEW